MLSTCTAPSDPISVNMRPYIHTILTLYPYTPDPTSVDTRGQPGVILHRPTLRKKFLNTLSVL